GIFKKAKREAEAQLFALRMELEAYTGLPSHTEDERPSKELDPVEEKASRWIAERVEKEMARLNPTDKPLEGHYERSPSEAFFENLRKDPELLAIIRPFLEEKRQSFENNPKKADLVPEYFGWDHRVDPSKRTDFIQD